MNPIIEKLNNISLRELDVLVGKYFYGNEVKLERVESTNNNNIKYLWLPKKSKKYSRNSSKSKTKLERKDSRYKPLPRWTTDIRDCWKLVLDANKKFGKISLNLLDNASGSVVVSNMEFKGRITVSAVRIILFLTLAEIEKNGNKN